MGGARALVPAGVGFALVVGGLVLLEPGTVFGSRLDGRRLLGVGLAVAGVVLLAACLGRLHRPGGRPWWPLIALGAGVLVVGAHLASPTSPVERSVSSPLCGVEMSAAYGTADEPETTWLAGSQILGAATATLGLALLAGLAGARLGDRRR